MPLISAKEINGITTKNLSVKIHVSGKMLISSSFEYIWISFYMRLIKNMGGILKKITGASWILLSFSESKRNDRPE